MEQRSSSGHSGQTVARKQTRGTVMYNTDLYWLHFQLVLWLTSNSPAAPEISLLHVYSPAVCLYMFLQKRCLDFNPKRCYTGKSNKVYFWTTVFFKSFQWTDACMERVDKVISAVCRQAYIFSCKHIKGKVSLGKRHRRWKWCNWKKNDDTS